ncbi:MAG TPA: hypothetical protein DCE23_01105 [Firmicutes bacterium]|nr:hypothetical protein [Bacillota bacterium]
MKKIGLFFKITLYIFIVLVIRSEIVSGNEDVELRNFRIDGNEVSNINVTDGISFVTKELHNIGDYSVLDYEIVNNSRNDKTIEIDCHFKSDNYIISNDVPSFIKGNDKERGMMKVTLVKLSDTKMEDNFSCKLNLTDK